MLGKVTIDLTQRTVGRLGLLYNKLTPTRGARLTSAALYGLSLAGPVKVEVGLSALHAGRGVVLVELPSSEHYARCLLKAGIRELRIESGVSLNGIKMVLDTLVSQNVKTLKASLEKLGVKTFVLANFRDFLDYAGSDFLAPHEVATLLHLHIPHSIPGKSHQVGGEPYGHKSYIPAGYTPVETVKDADPAYSVTDAQTAAEVINRHDLSKREVILQQLSSLNPGLSTAVRLYVNWA